MELQRPDGTFEALLRPGYRHIRQVEGLAGMRVRERKRARSHGHGARIRSRYRDANPVTITGDFLGENADRTWREYQRVAGALESATDTNRLLRYSLGSLALQMEVRLVEISAPMEAGADLIRTQYTLDHEDPRSYGQVELEATAAPLSSVGGGLTFPFTFPITFGQREGGVATVDHEGSSSSPPLMLLDGYLKNPVIQLDDTHRLVFDGSIAEGDVLYVDARDRSVSLNGQADRLNLLRFSESRWFDLPPQSISAVRLLADEFSPGAGLRVRYRPAYE